MYVFNVSVFLGLHADIPDQASFPLGLGGVSYSGGIRHVPIEIASIDFRKLHLIDCDIYSLLGLVLNYVVHSSYSRLFVYLHHVYVPLVICQYIESHILG